MNTWTIPQSDRYLSPHPWDTLGKPPRAGAEYDPPTDFDAALVMATKLREADDAYGEAESLKDEARSVEDHADELTKEAGALREKLNHERLALAIEKDPRAFRTEEAIREWLADPR